MMEHLDTVNAPDQTVHQVIAELAGLPREARASVFATYYWRRWERKRELERMNAVALAANGTGVGVTRAPASVIPYTGRFWLDLWNRLTIEGEEHMIAGPVYGLQIYFHALERARATR